MWYNFATMNRKLVPFNKFSRKAVDLKGASVITDQKGIPLGFVFGRDSFISFCTVIDEEFEKRVEDPKAAYNNPAGRLIDAIEEKLPLNPKFVSGLKSSIKKTRKTEPISFQELARHLNV